MKLVCLLLRWPFNVCGGAFIVCAAHRELLKYAARLLQERLQVIDCDLLLCGRHPRYLSIVSRLHRGARGAVVRGRRGCCDWLLSGRR